MNKIIQVRQHHKDLYMPAPSRDELNVTLWGERKSRYGVHRGLWDYYRLQHDKSSDRKKSYSLNAQSWQQLLDCVGIPKTYSQKLLTENPELLVDNINNGLNHINKTLLLRLTSDTPNHNDGDEIRAILPKTYNRFDNLYIVQSLLRIKDQLGDYEIKNVLYDGNFLHIEYLIANAKQLLRDVDDQIMIGFRITNSETSSTGKFSVRLYFERLVCTNGMTTGHSEDFDISKKIADKLDTLFPCGLPPNDLPTKLNEEIDEFLIAAIGEIKKLERNEYLNLQKEMASLRKQSVSIDNEQEALAHISVMLRVSGMHKYAGVSRDEIYQAYLEECKNSPHTKGTALVLYNAFTRYVSNFLSLEQPSHNQSGASHTIVLDRGSRIRLSENLFNRSHKLFASSLRWDRVIQIARKEILELHPSPPSI